MSYELNEQQISVKEQTVEFIKHYLANIAGRIEKEGVINPADLIAVKESGVWDAVISDSTDWVTKVTVLIELAKISPSFAGMFTDYVYSKSILADQSDQGFYATAFVEEEAGSDLSKIQTEARRLQESWVLTGEKWFVVNTGLAKSLLVLAKTPEQSFSIFKVPKDADGITIQEQTKMGMEGLKLSKVVLNQVTVPSSALVLSLGSNFEGLHCADNLAKLTVASTAIGIAEAALTESLDRARSRQQFGNSIGEYQAIQFKIAEITVGINAAKTLLYLAAQKLDRNEDAGIEAAMAKVYSTEISGKAVDHAVQIHGTLGLLTDSVVSQLYRSQRLTEIFAQTSEIQRIKIAEHVLNTIGINEREVNYGFSI